MTRLGKQFREDMEFMRAGRAMLTALSAILSNPEQFKQSASEWSNELTAGIRALSADTPNPTTGSTPATDGASPTSMSDGADVAREGFETACDWCHRTVINFVAPPAMVQIDVRLPGDVTVPSWGRICLECYTALLAFVADRAVTHE